MTNGIYIERGGRGIRIWITRKWAFRISKLPELGWDIAIQIGPLNIVWGRTNL